MRWQHCVVCACFACVYLVVAYLPLSPTVTWRHLQIGDWILSRRMLPNIDPFLPLADGMPWVTTSWLSEVLLSNIYRIGGAQGLSMCLALLTLAIGMFTARTAFVQTGRNRWAILAAGVVLAFQWPQITLLRPELFGLCCFVVLLWQIHRWQNDADEMPRSSWVFVPLLFALWANLDGSVFVGVFLMGCLALGGLIDSAWRTRSIGEAIGEPRSRRLVLLAELSAAATLLQPLGLDLWFDLCGGIRSTVVESAAPCGRSWEVSIPWSWPAGRVSPACCCG